MAIAVSGVERSAAEIRERANRLHMYAGATNGRSTASADYLVEKEYRDESLDEE